MKTQGLEWYNPIKQLIRVEIYWNLIAHVKISEQDKIKTEGRANLKGELYMIVINHPN